MDNLKKGMAWINENMKEALSSSYEVKHVTSDDGDLGKLSGIQFDSEEMGGYIYFWSSGFVAYQLVDYLREEEIIEDTTEEINKRPYDEIFKEMLLKLN